MGGACRMIGSYGSVTFKVSADTVKTFQDLARSEKGRWAKTDRVLLKPISQFLGPDLGTVTFVMKFNAQLGVNPRKETDKLIKMARNGYVGALILGGKRVGVAKWAMQGVDVNFKTIDNRGNVIIAEATVSLEEYV